MYILVFYNFICCLNSSFFVEPKRRMLETQDIDQNVSFSIYNPFAISLFLVIFGKNTVSEVWNWI